MNLNVTNHTITNIDGQSVYFEIDYEKVSNISAGGAKDPDLMELRVRNNCLSFED